MSGRGLSKVEIDDILHILENPLRRQILARLAREDHYPLQLAHELRVSQQAVMKHLHILAERGFVDVRTAKSDRGGPRRKVYSTKRHISVRIDLGPCTLETDVRHLPEPSLMEDDDLIASIRKEMEAVASMEDPSEARKKCISLLSRVNRAIDDLDAKRRTLFLAKGIILRTAMDTLTGHLDYKERSVLFEMLSSPGISPADLSETLDMRERAVKRIIEQHFQE